VELLLGVAAAARRPRERVLVLGDGREQRYHRLLIATGSRPRELPILTRRRNVSVLRTVDDSLVLRDALGDAERIGVIGAGFIGQEVAAAARRLGCAVTMVEAAAQPLAGILGPKLGAWFAAMHRAEGVEVLTGCTVSVVNGNGVVTGLQLSDGRRIGIDHALVGVGVTADVGWLAGSGVAREDCVPVDACGRTAAPHVFAAGDVAATLDPLVGRWRAGSHWEAAARGGARAARAMLGLDPGPRVPASFWSDQYGTRIQYVGHAAAGDAVSVDGDPDARNFTATFSRDGRAVAVLLVNRPRSLPAARALIERGTT
jgi:NADPH-dependent 2,4-dienoyl-CoA reductase/sulfur reductase-like enzyme